MSTFIIARTQPSPGAEMTSCRESTHIGTNDSNNRPGTSFTDTRNTLDCFRGFFLIKAHTVIYFIIQIFM